MAAVLALLLMPLVAERRGPSDVESLNRFAEAYNRYAAELHSGQVDLKQWQKVERAWKEVR